MARAAANTGRGSGAKRAAAAERCKAQVRRRLELAEALILHVSHRLHATDTAARMSRTSPLMAEIAQHAVSEAGVPVVASQMSFTPINKSKSISSILPPITVPPQRSHTSSNSGVQGAFSATALPRPSYCPDDSVSAAQARDVTATAEYANQSPHPPSGTLKSRSPYAGSCGTGISLPSVREKKDGLRSGGAKSASAGAGRAASPPSPGHMMCAHGEDEGEVMIATLSSHAVSSYLQSLVKEIVVQMEAASSAFHYNRHVLLVRELLRDDAVLGFTPTMVLAGVGTMLDNYADALMQGKLLTVDRHYPNVEQLMESRGVGGDAARIAATGAASWDLACSFGSRPKSHQTAGSLGLTARVGQAMGGVESYLPPLIPQVYRQHPDGTDAGAMQSFLAATDIQQQQQQQQQHPTSAGRRVAGPLHSPMSASAPCAVGGQRSTSLMTCDVDGAVLVADIQTVPEALLALVEHCARPLICLTVDDHRNLSEAVALLAEVLSGIVAKVETTSDEEVVEEEVLEALPSSPPRAVFRSTENRTAAAVPSDEEHEHDDGGASLAPADYLCDGEVEIATEENTPDEKRATTRRSPSPPPLGIAALKRDDDGVGAAEEEDEMPLPLDGDETRTEHTQCEPREVDATQPITTNDATAAPIHSSSAPTTTRQTETVQRSSERRARTRSTLGKLSVPEHRRMTMSIRLAALSAINALLGGFHEEVSPPDVVKVAMKPANGRRTASTSSKTNNSSKMKKNNTADDGVAAADTLLDATRQALQLCSTTTATHLVDRWAALLRETEHQPITVADIEEETNNGRCGAASANDDDDDDDDGVDAHQHGAALQLDSARNIHPVTAASIQSSIATTALGEMGSMKEDGIQSAAHTERSTGKQHPTRIGQLMEHDAEGDDDRRAHRRGVLSEKEEAEVVSILRVFMHLTGLEEAKHATSTDAFADPLDDHHHSVSHGAHVPRDACRLPTPLPALIVQTLARCAMGDQCASLCVDLLYRCMELVPSTTTRSILFDCPDDEERAVAAEHLLQALVHQLNAAHRLHQREVRNDLTIFITFLLRQSSQELSQLPVPGESTQCIASGRCLSARHGRHYELVAHAAGGRDVPLPFRTAYDSLPPRTVDALNVMVLLYFDLVCSAELSYPPPGSHAADGNQLIAYHLDNAHNPLLSRAALRQHALRYHGVASPTLRQENLQFKRLSWQLLEAFCEWQSAHVFYEAQLSRCRHLQPPSSSCVNGAAATTTTTTASASAAAEGGSEPQRTTDGAYEGLYLVDLCRMGLIDVLLLYVDTHCDHPAVVAWTREELVSLQAESWQLLTMLVQSAQNIRDRYLTRVDQTPRRNPVCARGSMDDDAEEDDDAPLGATAPQHEEEEEESTRCLLSPTKLAAMRNDAEEVEVNLDDPQDNNNTTDPNIHGAAAQQHDDDDELDGADIHFFAAGGVEVALRYIQDAPPSVERLKRMALMLIATVMRSGHHESILRILSQTPILIPLLVSLLENLRSVSSRTDSSCMGDGDAAVGGADFDFHEDGMERLNMLSATLLTRSSSQMDRTDADASSPPPRGLSRNGGAAPAVRSVHDFFLTTSTMMMALQCLDLIKNIGEVAKAFSERKQHSTTIHAAMGIAQADWNNIGIAEPSYCGNSHVHREGGLTTNTEEEDVEEAFAHSIDVMRGLPGVFRNVGGMAMMVQWMQQALLPNPVNAQGIATSAALTNGTTLSGMSALAAPITAIRAPPLSEAYLLRNIDLLLALLDVTRTVVMSDAENLVGFVNEDGVAALLNIIEAMAVASDSLFVEHPTEHYTSNPSVLVRDPAPVMACAKGQVHALRERRAIFTEVLRYAMAILADVLYAEEHARQHFLEWHSRRLEKKEVGNGGQHHHSSSGFFMNATQLMLSMWSAEVRESPNRQEFRAMMRASSFSASRGPTDRSGLALLRLSIGDSFRRTYRQEYARRLLRRRRQEGQEVAAAEFIRCYRYIEGKVNEVERVGDEVAESLMRELVDINDADFETARRQYTVRLISRAVGGGLKAFACLSAMGFTTLCDCSPALTPEERSRLIEMASFPALCMDEMCVSMAETGQVEALLPWSSFRGSIEPALDENGRLSASDRATFEARVDMFMRPTTPDRRCLQGVLEDIHTRGDELSQIIALGQAAGDAQQRDLYHRFLVTRIRQAAGGVVPGHWKTAHEAHIPHIGPAVVVPLSPTSHPRTVAMPAHRPATYPRWPHLQQQQDDEKEMMMEVDGEDAEVAQIVSAEAPPPLDLAARLAERLTEEHRRREEAALVASCYGHCSYIDDESAERLHASAPLPRSGSFLVASNEVPPETETGAAPPQHLGSNNTDRSSASSEGLWSPPQQHQQVPDEQQQQQRSGDGGEYSPQPPTISTEARPPTHSRDQTPHLSSRRESIDAQESSRRRQLPIGFLPTAAAAEAVAPSRFSCGAPVYDVPMPSAWNGATTAETSAHQQDEQQARSVSIITQSDEDGARRHTTSAIQPDGSWMARPKLSLLQKKQRREDMLRRSLKQLPVKPPARDASPDEHLASEQASEFIVKEVWSASASSGVSL